MLSHIRIQCAHVQADTDMHASAGQAGGSEVAASIISSALLTILCLHFGILAFQPG